jgi:tetratricopeptide (TPR) repeat protein
MLSRSARTWFSRASGVLVAAWVLATLGIVPKADAQSRQNDHDERPNARGLFLRGQESYGRGDYQAAIRSWDEAYKLDPRPLLQFNIAQAYEKQGKLQESIDALERYLATAAPDDAYQTEARARLGAVREKLRSTGIHIRGAPEGATIFVDHHDWGRTPRPDPVPARPGAHRVVVQLEGYRDFQTVVTVPAGKHVAVNAAMVPLEGGATAEGDAADSADGAGAGGARKSNLVPFILWGVAGAALVTGGVLGLMAMSQANDAPSSDSSEADKAKSLAIGADIALGTALVAGTVGTVLFFVNSSGDQKRASGPSGVSGPVAMKQAWSIAPVLSPTVQGASAYVRF